MTSNFLWTVFLPVCLKTELQLISKLLLQISQDYSDVGDKLLNAL